MNLEEFESQTRDILEQVLNQLQAATLLLTQLETQVSEASRTVQGLSQTVEQFINDQSNSSTDDTPSG